MNAIRVLTLLVSLAAMPTSAWATPCTPGDYSACPDTFCNGQTGECEPSHKAENQAIIIGGAVVFVIVTALFVGMLRRKGRELVTIVDDVVQARDRRQAEAGRAQAAELAASTQTCPMCLETIKRGARLCRYCGSKLNADT